MADEAAKPKPVETVYEIISSDVANDVPTACIVDHLIEAGHLRKGAL